MTQLKANRLSIAFSGLALAATAWVAPNVFADDGVKEEMAETARDAKKETKKTMRKVKDKTCEMVNGKMECTKKKIEHKIENVTDEVKDKTNSD